MNREGRSRLDPVARSARLLAAGFAAAASVGTLLLTLPGATVDGDGLSLVDAFFTATSAVCVTGLTVIDIGAGLTAFGQVVVLTLIQIGGLGVMTVTTFFAYAVGRRISLSDTLTVGEALGQPNLSAITRLARNVAVTTFAIEAAGAIALAAVWNRDYPLGRALYYGAFHAVSAFCNAGFDLFGRSLTAYVRSVPVNFIVAGLVVVGGLGFAVVSEVLSARRGRGLSLHTRVVLKTTAALIAAGTVLVLALEFSNPATLGPLAPGEKVLAALFQSVTPRTAGFNTVPIGSLFQPTLLLLIVLMFIGASPGSTGGGIKTTTFVTMLAAIRSALRGRTDVEIGERRVPEEVAVKAWVITALALGLVLAVTGVLLLTEGVSLMEAAFETVSALGTVGLSTGITPKLTVAGRIILPLVMYAGRVGPLTLAVALTRRSAGPGRWRYPEERVVVG